MIKKLLGWIQKRASERRKQLEDEYWDCMETIDRCVEENRGMYLLNENQSIGARTLVFETDGNNKVVEHLRYRIREIIKKLGYTPQAV